MMNRQNTPILTDNIIRDLLSRNSYRRMTREEEKIMIMKAKLSFYYDYEDEEDYESRDKALADYMEIFPRFKERYEHASIEKKERLLKKAVEKSTYYRDDFISNNIRLVVKYAYRRKKSGISIEDLTQEGILGMMTALKKFDTDSSNKFSTYAIYWIKQSIGRYIFNSSSIIRLPINLQADFNRIKKEDEKLTYMLGRKPTYKELGEAVGMSIEKIESLYKAASIANPTSLNEVIGEDEDNELGDLIPDKTTPIETKVIDEMMIDELKELLSDLDLSFREKKILYMRFGLNGYKVHSLEKVGEEFGVSSERIRQIEMKILRKIRNNEKLNDYYKTTISKNNSNIIKEEKNIDINNPQIIENRRKQIEKDRNTRESIRNILLKTDLSNVEEETKLMLGYHYGLSGVYLSIFDISQELNIPPMKVRRKIKDTLQELLKTSISLGEADLVYREDKLKQYKKTNYQIFW